MGSAALLASCSSNSSSGGAASSDLPAAGLPVANATDGFVIARRFTNTSLTPGSVRLPVSLAARDQTLFQRADMVEAGWNIVAPVLDLWSALAARDFPNYAAGSWGPKEALELMARDGRAWRTPNK